MGRGGDEDLSVDQLCGELLFGNQSSAGHWPEGSWNAAGPGVEHQQQAPKQEGSSWSEQGVIVPQSQWLYMPELDNLAGGAHHGEQQRAVMSNFYEETQTRNVIQEAAMNQHTGIEETLHGDMFGTESFKSEKMPSGWEERRAPDGRSYYVDHRTQKTQWKDPRLTSKQQLPPPPPPQLQLQQLQPLQPQQSMARTTDESSDLDLGLQEMAGEGTLQLLRRPQLQLQQLQPLQPQQSMARTTDESSDLDLGLQEMAGEGTLQLWPTQQLPEATLGGTAAALPPSAPLRTISPAVAAYQPTPRDAVSASRSKPKPKLKAKTAGKPSSGAKRSKAAASSKEPPHERWEWPPADDPAREEKSAARNAALHRFRQKKIERANRPKNVRYKSRKKIADDRPRVSGRFVKTASVMRANTNTAAAAADTTGGAVGSAPAAST
jgi:hypothetical protein